MPNPWFKFYGGEYLSDEKIMELDANERSIWVTILCLASQKNGVINASESTIIKQSGVAQKIKYRGVFDKFVSKKMIDLSNGNVTVCNWGKRQHSESYDRVSRFREKQKSNGQETTDRDKELDKDIYSPKGENALWVKTFFEELKKLGIKVLGDPTERQRYPSLMRRKNSDVWFWIRAAHWSQKYGFKKQHEYIMPYREKLTLPKLYYDIYPKIIDLKAASETQSKLGEMKKEITLGKI